MSFGHFTRTLALGASLCAAVCSPLRAQDAPPATRPAGNGQEKVALTVVENANMKALIELTGATLGLRFLYDEQIAQQVVTIPRGVSIPKGDLLGFLEKILQQKGYTIADMGQPGWKQLVPSAQMTAHARVGPTTRPEPGPVTRIFVLQVIDAARLEALLKPFLSQPGGSAIAIAEQRLLIVTDYASNVGRIASLVKMMDQQTREVVIEFVALEHGDAQDISQKVATIMQATINTSGVQNPMQIGTVEVGFDNRTNQIALVGGRDRVAEAIKVVKRFDVPVTLTTQTYQFENASPDRVDKLMKQMLDPAVAKRVYQAGVDKEARLLVVTGTTEIHQRIEAMKKAIDVAVAIADSPIQFYKLSNTSARDVVRTLKAIQGEESGGGYGDLFDPFGENRGGANPLSRRRGGFGGRAGMYGRNADAFGDDPSAPRAPRRPRLGGRSSVGGFGAATQPTDDTQADTSGGGSFQTDNATITADLNTNSIIVVAEPAVQKVYEQLIKTLDKRRPQVLIECTLVTLDTSRNFSLGVDIGINSPSGIGDVVTFSSFGVSVPQTAAGAGSAATGRLALVPGAAGFNGALLSGDIADIVVNALLRTNRARVVSAPRILVNDNATGSLMSIAEQPYTVTNIGDTIATTSFGAYAEAGTTIDLTPHISEANYLQLEYDVSLNQFTGTGTSTSPPPRQTSSLSSTVTIPDGSTIIIGGLNSTTFRESVNAIPFLGEIPVLKYLFGSRGKDQGQTTLFVFIRPVVLRDDRFADLKYLSERDVKSAGLAPDDPVSEPLLIQ